MNSNAAVRKGRGLLLFVVGTLFLAACSSVGESLVTGTPEEQLIPRTFQPTPDEMKATPQPAPDGPVVTPQPAPSLGPCLANGSDWDEGDAWRFGVGLAEAIDVDRWGRELGISWYLDWAVRDRPGGQMPIHWQMIRLSEDGYWPGLESILKTARDHPGSMWIVGNEPDVIWQDNTTPERVADLYWELYQAIKEVDETAKVGVGAVGMVSPLRIAYLERILTAYQTLAGEPLPADFWTVHVYVLREERDSWGVEIPPGFTENEGQLWEVADHDRIDIFNAQIRSFRTWMEANGYRNLPLALTEFGILMPEDYGFPPDRVRAYMLGTLDSLLTMRDEKTGYPQDGNRLVQQWAWFSLVYSTYSNSDLVDPAGDTLTPLGDTYQACIQKVSGH